MNNLKSIPHLRIYNSDLIKVADHVSQYIVDTLRHQGNKDNEGLDKLSPWHPCMGDIFSSIDQVELSLSDDIKLAEGVLQPKEAKEQETPEARFNRDFDKFMDELDDQLLPNIVKELEQWSDDISARLS